MRRVDGLLGWLTAGLIAATGAVWAQPHPPHGATAVGTAARPPAGGVVLRVAYVQGHRVRYVQRSVQTVAAAGGQTVTTSTMEIETVAVHPDGTADQRMRVVSMDLTGGGIPPAARAAITRGLTGATIEYSQDNRGRITARHAATGVSDDMRPVVDGVVQTMDQLSPQLPEGPVAVGATWQDHQTLHLTPAPGATLDMTMDVTYTLREVHPATAPGGRAAVLAVTTTFGTPAGTAIQGVPLRGTGTSTGSMTLDLAYGCVAASRSTGSMNLHMAIPGRAVDLETHLENDLHTEPVPQ